MTARILLSRDMRRASRAPRSRGLHYFTSQLKLSACNGIGAAHRCWVAFVKERLGGVYGVQGAFVCPTRLKLS